MKEKHPYISGSGGLIQAVNHLRKAFPSQVTAETLKKLGIAPNNETYVLNILRFINVLDAEGKKTTKADSVFTKHDLVEFQKGFGEMVEAAYADLFALHGKDSWALSTSKLISYFRGADHTSAVVGQRQAGTFQTLAGLTGHGQTPSPKPITPARRVEKKGAGQVARKKAQPEPTNDLGGGRANRLGSGPVGLAVRIEINLPVAPDQETYDRIFKSIRENLLSGE